MLERIKNVNDIKDREVHMMISNDIDCALKTIQPKETKIIEYFDYVLVVECSENGLSDYRIYKGFIENGEDIENY